MEDVMGGSAVIKTREFRRGITWLDYGIFTYLRVCNTFKVYLYMCICVCPFLVSETGIFRKSVAMHPERLYMPNASCF
jgi:hypothetical protein